MQVRQGDDEGGRAAEPRPRDCRGRRVRVSSTAASRVYPEGAVLGPDPYTSGGWVYNLSDQHNQYTRADSISYFFLLHPSHLQPRHNIILYYCVLIKLI